MAVDFFKKYKWKPGEVDWHFLILFDNDPQVTELAKSYHELLQHPGLYPPIPMPWLHATLLRVGPTDIISEEDMRQVSTLLTSKIDKLVIPPVTLGSPWVWSGSVCLSMTPEEPLKELFNVINEAKKEVLQDRAPAARDFIPHVTLAYPRDTDDEDGISRQLLSKKVAPVSFQPTELCLVKQRQTSPYYQWEVVSRLSLRSGGEHS